MNRGTQAGTIYDMFAFVFACLLAGLVSASFLMIAAWFARSPLAMMFRLPIVISLAMPFGVFVAAQ